ncbi:MAG: DUF892 family protein [Sediminicola sp.]
MKNLQDLFEHQLKDLYSAEKQLLTALPKMAKAARDQQLQNAFKSHEGETREHLTRLEEIGEELEIDLKGEECKAMKGLIEEMESFLMEDVSPEVLDAGLIAEAQRAEHYEISAYGTTTRYAKELGFEEIAKKLHLTLEEEKSTDEKLTSLAEQGINQEAEN